MVTGQHHSNTIPLSVPKKTSLPAFFFLPLLLPPHFTSLLFPVLQVDIWLPIHFCGDLIHILIPNGVVTHLEPDILECEVKWTLWSISTNKVSGGDVIPAKLLQILKDDAVNVLDSICQQIWKTSSGHRTGKWQFSFQFQKGQCQRMFKLLYNCAHFTC